MDTGLDAPNLLFRLERIGGLGVFAEASVLGLRDAGSYTTALNEGFRVYKGLGFRI